jgi:hypothetical protein
MRRTLVLLAITAMLVLSLAPAASAHVHGITPLLCEGVGSPMSGGNGTNDTPAAAANGGPIAGLIPATVGNAPLAFGDGGFQPAGNPHC